MNNSRLRKQENASYNWRRTHPKRARNLQYKYYSRRYIKDIPLTSKGLEQTKQVDEWINQGFARVKASA